MHYLFRPYTNDYRFSVPQLAEELGAECRTRRARVALAVRCLELGAVHIGGGRVNLADGREVMKDSIYSVKDWDAFLAALRDGVPLPTDAPAVTERRPARKATRLDRIEKKLDRILAILADER